MLRTLLEAYAFYARFGKRSVFILDPRRHMFDIPAISTWKLHPTTSNYTITEKVNSRQLI